MTRALRLTKAAPTIWNGNGFGTQAAQWTLRDFSGWSIWQAGTQWVARHSTGKEVRGDTRAALLEKLADHIRLAAFDAANARHA